MGVPAGGAWPAAGAGVLKLKPPLAFPKSAKLGAPLTAAPPKGRRLGGSALRLARRAVPVTGVLPGVNMLTAGVKRLGVLAAAPPAARLPTSAGASTGE